MFRYGRSSFFVADSAETTGLKWAAPASGQKSFTLANAGGTALTGATTVTVSGLDADQIFIFIDGVSSATASNTKFFVRLNTDTNSNYNNFGNLISAPSTYSSSILERISAQAGNATSGIYIGSISDSVTSVGDVYVSIFGAKSTNPKTYTFAGGFNAAGSNTQRNTAGGGYYTGTSAISSISVVSLNGNLDAGTVYVYTSA